MIKLLSVLMALLLGLSVAGCRDAQKSGARAEAPDAQEPTAVDVRDPMPPPPSSLMAGRKFILVQVNGVDYNKDKAPVIGLENDHKSMSGKVCNSFRGSVVWAGDGVLALEDAAVTKMACIDQDLAALENLLLRMLSSGASLQVDDPYQVPADIITLKQGDDTLVFKAVDAEG